MLAFAGVALVSWIVGAAFQLEAAAWPLFGSLVAIVVLIGARLNESERMWVRTLGVLLVAALAIGLLLLALVLWYGAQICDSCD